MDARQIRIVLDTNILISALGFGGKPRRILSLILENQAIFITSPVLLAEFENVVIKKFPELASNLDRIKKKLKERCTLVKPKVILFVLKDDADNRVLEAAVAGKCNYIITGDKALLELRSYQDTTIVTADQFLELLKE